MQRIIKSKKNYPHLIHLKYSKDTMNKGKQSTIYFHRTNISILDVTVSLQCSIIHAWFIINLNFILLFLLQKKCWYYHNLNKRLWFLPFHVWSLLSAHLWRFFLNVYLTCSEDIRYLIKVSMELWNCLNSNYYFFLFS